MNRNQTPARLRHTVALAVCLGCSSAAISIGLGPIHVNSSIGQPMSATIPVEGLTAASAKGATVQLASAAAYRARGIELLPSHQKLRFSLVPSGKGYVIRVTSTASIREPFVNFLITINSNGSTVTREYAAFFNPDPLNPNAAEPMAVVEKPTLADSDSKSKKKGKKDKAEKAERELLPVGEPESRAELAGTRRSEPVLANPKKEKEQKESVTHTLLNRHLNKSRRAKHKPRCARQAPTAKAGVDTISPCNKNRRALPLLHATTTAKAVTPTTPPRSNRAAFRSAANTARSNRTKPCSPLPTPRVRPIPFLSSK